MGKTRGIGTQCGTALFARPSDERKSFSRPQLAACLETRAGVPGFPVGVRWQRPSGASCAVRMPGPCCAMGRPERNQEDGDPMHRRHSLWATSRHKTLRELASLSDGSADEYFRMASELVQLRANALAAMSGADIVLSPAVALPAVRHGATAELNTLGTYAPIGTHSAGPRA